MPVDPLDALRKHLPAKARVRLDQDPALGDALREAVTQARAEHPDVSLDPAALGPFLATKLSALPPEQWLSLRFADLLLVAAALEKDRVALASLDAVCARVVSREAARTRLQSHADDVCQTVQQLLLAPASGGPPALAQYSGKGELAAWLRVIAVRELLHVKKRSQRALARETPEDDALELAAAPSGSPELGLLRGHYRDAFRAAFREAVEGLGNRPRLLLRQHFLDGLTLDALARLHQVHRATIARWIAQAREEIAEATRDRLREHLARQPAGLQSVLAVVGSQLEVSLGALLRTLHS